MTGTRFDVCCRKCCSTYSKGQWQGAEPQWVRACVHAEKKSLEYESAATLGLQERWKTVSITVNLHNLRSISLNCCDDSEGVIHKYFCQTADVCVPDWVLKKKKKKWHSPSNNIMIRILDMFLHFQNCVIFSCYMWKLYPSAPNYEQQQSGGTEIFGNFGVPDSPQWD